LPINQEIADLKFAYSHTSADLLLRIEPRVCGFAICGLKKRFADLKKQLCAHLWYLGTVQFAAPAGKADAHAAPLL
jgi:hypothetical protein